MREVELTKHLTESSRHATGYLAAGPEEGPLVICCHGWPELSYSWRHQLSALAALGFRAVAPDMRGYGRSSIPTEAGAYALEEIVADMIELLDHLGRERAVWVGHDWGAPVVWDIASHHPDRCDAVAAFSVPYGTVERGLDAMIELVDRSIYPLDEFPAGQWEYMLEYQERFGQTTAVFDADPRLAVKALWRRGDPGGAGKPAPTAFVHRDHGWFGGATVAPDVPIDPVMLDEHDLGVYAAALTDGGFTGPGSWYVNHDANAAYAAEALNDGRLEMPVFFLVGAYEYTCECFNSRFAVPMGEMCSDLVTAVVPSGHRMSHECPEQVNSALVHWLATRVPAVWPGPDGLPRVRTGRPAL